VDSDSRTQYYGRILLTFAVNAISLAILDWLFGGLHFDSPWALLATTVSVGIANAFVAPAVSKVAVPFSVLTLGLGSILIDGLITYIALSVVPGVHVSDVATGIAIAIGLSIINTLFSVIFSIDNDKWVDRRIRKRMAKHSKGEIILDPGLVIVQIDGLAHAILQRAIRNGDAPNLGKLIRDRSHVLRKWETDWSSQTGASQSAILLGSNKNMPAFRWVDKKANKTIVSNSVSSAAYIESLHHKEDGLLFKDGASFGNIFTGGAERAILTMSVAGKKKGKLGEGYSAYFSQPYNTTRTAVRFLGELAREWRGRHVQKQREVYPAIERDWKYAFARAFTTVIQQDVCVDGVIGEMAQGRGIIYVDLLGYDEVAHHAGPERFDALFALRSIDRQIKRIANASQQSKRPYKFVVLSDHGQSQGPTFRQQNGFTLEELVMRLCGTPIGQTSEKEVPTTEGQQFFNPEKKEEEEQKRSKAPKPIQVMASGNLGLVYFTHKAERLSLEEINELHPDLISKLALHPGIGFVLVNSEKFGPICIGPKGTHYLERNRVEGEDPLAPFGPLAKQRIIRTNSFSNVGDLMINAAWDESTQSTGAFEELVGSHGGMGGEQSQPFLLSPIEMAVEPDLFGAEQIYATLMTFRDGRSTRQEVLVDQKT
jgi:uncharacterized membrane protein YvlD (DUF360 family)